MESKIWGPPGWFFLHTITFSYPDKPTYKDKTKFYDFFMNLQYVLPCNICKQHYIENLKEYPISPHLDSKKDLVEWLVKIHNSVNVKNGKPQMLLSDVIDKYGGHYIYKKPYCYVPDVKSNKNTIIILSSIIFIMLIIIVLLCIKKKKL